MDLLGNIVFAVLILCIHGFHVGREHRPSQAVVRDMMVLGTIMGLFGAVAWHFDMRGWQQALLFAGIMAALLVHFGAVRTGFFFRMRAVVKLAEKKRPLQRLLDSLSDEQRRQVFGELQPPPSWSEGNVPSTPTEELLAPVEPVFEGGILSSDAALRIVKTAFDASYSEDPDEIKKIPLGADDYERLRQVLTVGQFAAFTALIGTESNHSQR